MIKKYRCLLLLSRVPFPPVGGDRLKSYNLIQILAEKYELHLALITHEDLSSEAIAFINQFCHGFVHYKRPRFKFFLNTAKAFISKKPLQVEHYNFKSIDELISYDSIDFVIVNLVRLVPYVEKFRGPVFFDIVDSIGLNYLSSRKKVRSWFWKVIYNIEAKRLLAYEKYCIKKFTTTFFVNSEECSLYSQYGLTKWIPNGVNDKLFQYIKIDPKYTNGIAFFGKMDYQPNIDAALWLIKNVAAALPHLHFYIIGANPTEKLLNLSKAYPNVSITGFMEDPYVILNSCACVVSPMQTGGGIQNKILEAMALGQINILTTKAASPIKGAIAGTHFLLADSVEDMKNYISNITINRIAYGDIGTAAKRLMMSNYTWQNYSQKLFNMIDSVVKA